MQIQGHLKEEKVGEGERGGLEKGMTKSIKKLVGGVDRWSDAGSGSKKSFCM